jgi:hypothetical protein
MGSAPAWLVIEPFLVTLDTLPTNEVRGAVRSDEFNYVISDSITTLAALDCLLFGHLVYFVS